MIRALVEAQRASAGLSRRRLLAGAGGLGLMGLLAACGTKGISGGAALSPAQDLSASQKVVDWANWTLYLDVDDSGKNYPSLQQFKKATGITCNYSEDIDGNDTYYGKVQAQLARGQNIGRDIITLTDWMAARVIRQGYVQELTASAVPNVHKNILPNLKDVDFDPGRHKSVTWQTGYAGIAWNKEKVPGGLKNVSDLWDPSLKGRISVLDEMRDTMGLLMLDDDVDIAGGWGDQEFDKGIDTLTRQVQDGQIRKVAGNSYKEDFISGDALAGIVWSGDITQMNFENNDRWQFAIPERGGTLWSDNMMVPMGATHKSNAEKLMNFYYEPEIAAEVAAYVNYICPVQGAKEAMEKLDPSLVDNALIFPTEEDLSHVKIFRSLSPAEETDYNEKFQSAIGA